MIAAMVLYIHICSGNVLYFRRCGQTCKGSSSIMFAWAKNAPPTQLPKGYSFHLANFTVCLLLVILGHLLVTLCNLSHVTSGMESGVIANAQILWYIYCIICSMANFSTLSCCL